MQLCIHGALGRMGQRLLAMAHADADLTVAGAVEYAGHPLVGHPVGPAIGVPDLHTPLSDALDDTLQGVDVVVTFAIPEATVECVNAARDAGVACIVGTTGLTPKQGALLGAAAKDIVLVQAANFSLGVNMLFKLAEDVARQIGQDFDIEIVEMHHNQKIDAPSGTAMRLAEGVARGVDRALDVVGVYGRHGQVGKRAPDEIGIMTLRGGDVVGDHTVIFAGAGERLELTHRAQSRDNFAKGALTAAKWTAGRSPGRYDMFDVLGLR